MKTKAYQPKTGHPCSCKRGVERDNCPVCEGTGQVIDFAAIRARSNVKGPKVVHIYGHGPMFEFTFDERAIVISALKTFTGTFPQDESARMILSTIESIDEAMRIMRTIANEEVS